MIPVSFDCESALVEEGLSAPPLTCLQIMRPGEGPRVVHVSEAGAVWRALLADPGVLLVGHNAAFDLCVLASEFPDTLPAVFAALDADRVTDTMLRSQLIDLARGEYRGWTDASTGVRTNYSYSLAALSKRLLGRELDKSADSWRTRYGELRDTPVAWWPEEARRYAEEDARATLDVYRAQEDHAPYLVDQHRQTRAAFALRLVQSWGMRTDPGRVDALVRRVEGEVAGLTDRLRAAGLVRADGSRDTKAAKALMEAACARRGVPPKLTETGQVCLDAEACGDSDDPLLEAYAERSALRTILDKDIPQLRKGVVYTDFVPLMETGRTSATGWNSQNVRKDGGVRETFVPRPGRVFVGADYDGMELRTFAQVCLATVGRSALAEILNAGQDPHVALAAERFGEPYDALLARYKAGDPEASKVRHGSKAANFGLPGGLGIDRYIALAKKDYGLRLTREQAEQDKAAWFRRYPEAHEYFRWVKIRCEEGGITQLYSGRARGLIGFTEAANGMFQGLGADMTKAALYALVKECFVGRGPLRGSRVVNYVHDEFLTESPAEVGHECAQEQARIMAEAARPWLPDVPATATPYLARCWSKRARPVLGGDGRLVPWTDKEAA